MKVSHTPAAVSAAFDDRNLIAYAGLVPVMRLAERCGLSHLVAEKVKLPGAGNGAGAAADAKVTSIVGGMAAGADSIDDLHLLRHGAMPAVFDGITTAPLRLDVLDAKLTVEAGLIELAEQTAAAVQHAPITPAPPRRSWPTDPRARRTAQADDTRRNRLALRQSKDPRRWRYTGQRTAPLAALWLLGRTRGVRRPWRPCASVTGRARRRWATRVERSGRVPFVGAASLPLHHLWVVDQHLGFRETRTAEELNQVLVVVGEAEDVPVRGHPAAAGCRRPVHDYRCSSHASYRATVRRPRHADAAMAIDGRIGARRNATCPAYHWLRRQGARRGVGHSLARMRSPRGGSRVGRSRLRDPRLARGRAV